METRMVEVCDAIYYCVLCEMNDYTDIMCGGSSTLGYDFYVSPDENVDETIEFIKTSLKKHNRPVMHIGTAVHADFPVKLLWTRAMIDEYIKEYNL